MTKTGDGMFNGMTPWVKAISYVGVPAVTMGFLIWYITLGPGQRSSAIELKLDSHIEHTEKLHKTFEEYVRINTLLMRQLCISGAKQAGDDPNNCLRP